MRFTPQLLSCFSVQVTPTVDASLNLPFGKRVCLQHKVVLFTTMDGLTQLEVPLLSERFETASLSSMTTEERQCSELGALSFGSMAMGQERHTDNNNTDKNASLG